MCFVNTSFSVASIIYKGFNFLVLSSRKIVKKQLEKNCYKNKTNLYNKIRLSKKGCMMK